MDQKHTVILEKHQPEPIPEPATPKHTVINEPTTGQNIQGDGRKIVGYLTSFSRTDTGESWIIRQGRNRLGSDPTQTDLTLHEGRVSDLHANLTVRRSGQDNRLMFILSDNNSVNGTYVNGEDIEYRPRELQHGDKVTLGGYELLVFIIDTEQLGLLPNTAFETRTAPAPSNGKANGADLDYSDYDVQDANATRIGG